MDEYAPVIPLANDEAALLRYFRNLSGQQQLALLEAAESYCNTAERMRELAARKVERLPPQLSPDLH